MTVHSLPILDDLSHMSMENLLARAAAEDVKENRLIYVGEAYRRYLSIVDDAVTLNDELAVLLHDADRELVNAARLLGVTLSTDKEKES